MTNPITKEIRDIRHRLAEQFDNDLDRIFADLKQKEIKSGLKTIDLSRRTDNKAIRQSNGGHDF